MNRNLLTDSPKTVVESVAPGTLNYARFPDGNVTLVAGVDDDFIRHAIPLNRQFAVLTFREDGVSAVLLTLELNKEVYRLWLDYWGAGGRDADFLSGLASQDRITATLHTSQRVIATVTFENPYRSLLADFITQVQQSPAWSPEDFARTTQRLA